MTSYDEYVEQYGNHFSRKLYEWAVSMMKGKGGGKMEPMKKEQVRDFLRVNGVTLENDKGHDAAYVLAMAMSDYFGSSITDDQHLSKFVKDYLEDPDGQSTKAFDHFVVDCRAKGEPIFWEEMM